MMQNQNSRTVIDVRGAIHLHTQYSDGAASATEMIQTAQNIGLDYIIITDHMTLKAREDGFEGKQGDLLVSVGYEHNDRNNHNHYLALGVRQRAGVLAEPQEYIDEIHRNGGIGFLAHPCEKRHYFAHLPPYPWHAWDAQNFDGIEIWNQTSDWVEHLKTYFSVVRFFYPRRYLFGISADLLKRWDDCNRERFVAGLGGVDAHARRLKWGPFSMTVFPLKVELKAIRTHVYVDEEFSTLPFEESHPMLLKALRDGRSFVSNFRWGEARGTRFKIFYANGESALPGRQERAGALPARLAVVLPLAGKICLYKNGVHIDTAIGKEAEFTINASAVYRVEVYRKRRAWIYSNPFPVGEYPF